MTKEKGYEVGGDNVFADIGVPNAEERRDLIAYLRR